MTKVTILGTAIAISAVAALGAATERTASDIVQLRAAIRAANPGDVIVMKNGTWTDAEIVFDAAATESAPVRLRAEAPGGVVLTGSSRLTFAAPHLAAEGLFFKGGALTGGSVVEFASHHGRLTDTAIVDYNPASGTTEYWWVLFTGSDNRVDRCHFSGKNNRRPVVTNRDGARRNRVDSSHFKDIAFVDENGRETIQIMGYGMSEELGDDGAFFTAERNLFEEAHGEGMEIISIKSNRNLIRGNTFRRTKGGITNRSGNYNVIEGNTILGEREPRTYGIRITGQHHRVVNNHVADVDGTCFLMVAGEHIRGALTPEWQPLARAGTPLGRVPRYAQVKHVLVAHNTFVNCRENGIEVGSSYRAGWPQSQRVLLPEENRIVDNVIRKTARERAIVVTKPDSAAPLNAFEFRPNVLEANVVDDGAALRSNAPVAGTPLSGADVGPSWLKGRGPS